VKPRVTEADLAASRDQLQRDADDAIAAMKEALRQGGLTAPHREKLGRIEAAIKQHAAQVEAIRREADAARREGIAEAGRAIAKSSVEKLRFTLAALAAPRRPGALRHRGRA
jgi:hypothetical protein